MTGPVWTLPGSRPYTFTFPPASTGLVIIDVQKDFVDPGGFGESVCPDPKTFTEARKVVPPIRSVLDKFREIGASVIFTREGHHPDLSDLSAAKKARQTNAPNGENPLGIGDLGPMGRLLVRGERGHDIVQELTPWPGEVVIDKPGKGSMFQTGLEQILLAKGLTHLIFTGVTTECCVTSTLRECNDRGYQCCVLEDCTTGFDARQVSCSLDIVSAQNGLFGFVAHSLEVLEAARNAAAAKEPLPIQLPLKKLPPIFELSRLYRQEKTTCEEVINLAFDLIDVYKNKDSAVWTHLQTRDECLNAARNLMAQYKGKPLPPLYGIPFSVKDNFDVAGIPTKAACEAYGYMPKATCPAVQALLDAGGLFVGKTNMDQLATGMTGCRSPFGIPHSVYSDRHITGGSSSGAGVSVGAGLVSFGLGSDTGGSGRAPAAYNGVVGLKPTKGTISAAGVVPACSSLDTVAVFAKTVGESRAVWQVIAQYDANDPYAKLPRSLPTWTIDFRGVSVAGFSFMVPPEAVIAKYCCSEVVKAFDEAVSAIVSAGGRRENGHIDYGVFEDAGELLYGGTLVHERVTCIGETFLRNNLSKLHPVTSALFERTLASPPSPYDVFRDHEKRLTLTRQVEKAFNPSGTNGRTLDVLIVPTTPMHPTIAEVEADPLAVNSKLGGFVQFANVVDMCGVNIPAGVYTSADGTRLPFGITLLGGSGCDAKVMDIAAVLESAFEFQGLDGY